MSVFYWARAHRAFKAMHCKICIFIDGLHEYRVVDGLDRYKDEGFDLLFDSSNLQGQLWGRGDWVADGQKEIVNLIRRLKT